MCASVQWPNTAPSGSDAASYSVVISPEWSKPGSVHEAGMCACQHCRQMEVLLIHHRYITFPKKVYVLHTLNGCEICLLPNGAFLL